MSKVRGFHHAMFIFLASVFSPLMFSIKINLCPASHGGSQRSCVEEPDAAVSAAAALGAGCERERRQVAPQLQCCCPGPGVQEGRSAGGSSLQVRRGPAAGMGGGADLDLPRLQCSAVGRDLTLEQCRAHTAGQGWAGQTVTVAKHSMTP